MSDKIYVVIPPDLGSKGMDLLKDIMFQVVKMDPNRVYFVKCNSFLKITEGSVIITVGENSLNILTDLKGVTKYAGTIQTSTFNIPVVPIVSPGFIEHNPNYLRKFAEDILTAHQVSLGMNKGEVSNQFKVVTDISLIDTLCDYIEQTGYCSFDFETTEIMDMGTFDPDFSCTTLAISFQQGSAYVIPLYHPESPFSDSDIKEIFKLLQERVFGNPDIVKIGHNVKYDMHCAAWCGVTSFRGPYHDTMLMHQLYNEILSHKLKDIIRDFFPRFANYEIALAKNWEAGLDVLAQYNAWDSDLTFRLYWVLTKILMEDDRLYLMYRNLTAPATKALFQIEESGMLVDKAFIIESINQVQKMIDDQESIMRIHTQVQKYEAIKTEELRVQMIEDLTKKLEEAKVAEYKSKTAIKNNENRILNLNNQIIGLKSGSIQVEPYVVNFNSPDQLKHLLFDKDGFGFPISSPKFGAKSDSTSADNLDLIKDDSGFIESLKVTRQLKKILSTYLNSILNKLDEDHFIHTNFNQHVAKTGRLCIEGNQLVQIPGGSKAIKDIQINDLVYCYDNDNNLRIRKVLNKWNKGVHPIVKLVWQSSSNGNNTTDYGELLCTPNHFIKTFNGWVEAKDLKINDRLFHLSRRDHIENGVPRTRLYFSVGNMKKEQIVIKQELFNCFDSKIAIHHKDFNPANNYPDNLELMDKSIHSGMHTKLLLDKGKIKWDHLKNYKHIYQYGENNLRYIHKTRYQLLKMLYKAGGRPTYIDMDFNTFKEKCALYNINITEVSKRFNRDGLYINRGLLKNAFKYSTHKKLKLGYYRAKELYEYYNMTNHRVKNVIPWGETEVYDIEVEDYNNFIASEICVHNSSDKPNLQNIITRTKYKEVEDAVAFVKKSFIVPDEYTLVQADYSQMELRVIAHFADEKTMIDAYRRDQDIHELTAANSRGYTLEEFKKLDPKLYKQYRYEAKAENFGFIYGISSEGFREYARTTYDLKLSQRESEHRRAAYFKKYPNLLKYHQEYISKAKKFKYVRTMFGRKIHLPDIDSINSGVRGHAERNAINSPIQGTAGEMTIFAVALLTVRLPKEVYIVNTIHDSIMFYIPDNMVSTVIPIIKETMENLPAKQYFGREIDSLPIKVDFEYSKKSWKELVSYIEK